MPDRTVFVFLPSRMANMILDGVKIPKPVLLLAAAAGTAATYYALRSKL